MARSHGKLHVTIWADDDYQALTIRAQWLYTALLAHPRLTLAGTLDVWPTRWARHATDADETTAQAALDELEDARFVVVDRRTEEVMIRRFSSWDLDPNRVNKNLGPAVWSAWKGVLSPALRSTFTHEMPEPLWDRLAKWAPPEAEETRRSPRLEPEPRPPVATEPAPPGRDRDTPSRSQPTPTPTPPTDATTTTDADSLLSSQSDSRPEPPADEIDEAPPPDRHDRAAALARRIGTEDHDRAEADGKVQARTDHGRAKHRDACIRSAETDHLEKLQRLIHAHPDWTDDEILERRRADHERPERGTVPLDESRHPAVVAQQRTDATREPDGPPASPEAVRRLKAEALSGLASTRTLAAVPDPQEPTP